MHEREKDIFHEFYGPFKKTVFVLIEDNGTTFRLSFDEGPEYNAGDILDDKKIAFKVVAGTIFEIRVSVLYGKKLQFHGTQIPTFAPVLAELAPPVPEPQCMSIDCDSAVDCPDPTKPVMTCIGGIPKCEAIQ